ncbi:hypothetical protein C882_0845 [Caenispirillum salinarum AK4]|uniref:Response regulatory domain-containing protein n=1 Tax=Caenispirillum salinarum AK4 TaxID=1238182 RepID=K9HDT9_9PROT|nr:hypothetical protein [Caenispirillum salinarum]EKV28633.1 hypothetical protein C882_0845 [Caenispirillum salinarum AK4]
MSQFLKPFLVALDGHPEVADMIAESAEAEGFDAVALQDRRLLETAVAVAAADVLVVDLDAADRALAALSRRPEQERPPRVILMTDAAISGAATPVGLAAEVVATLHKPLTDVGLTDALREALAAVRADGTGR